MVPIETKREAFLLSYELRKRGVNVDIQYNQRKLNKILNRVDREGIPFVLVLGLDEIANQHVTLKCFRDGSTHDFSLDAYDEMASFIQNY